MLCTLCYDYLWILDNLCVAYCSRIKALDGMIKKEPQDEKGLIALIIALAETMPLEMPVANFSNSIANAEATITKYIGSDAKVVVPVAINGLPVTVIGDNVFYRNLMITAVLLPNTVHTIDECAFTHRKSLTAFHQAKIASYRPPLTSTASRWIPAPADHHISRNYPLSPFAHCLFFSA